MYENYETKKTFSEAIIEKATKMLSIVAIVTFATTFFIKANNVVANTMNGGTILSYWIAFIVFILLLTIGTGVLVKNGMDIYPFYQSVNNNIEEDKGTKIINNKEEEKITTKENTVNSSGLVPIETVTNPVVPAIVPAVVAPVITNNEFYPMEENISNNNVVTENLPEDIDCLWEENDSFIV